MRLPQLFPVELGLMQVFDGFVGVMSLEVLLSYRLIDWNISAVDEVLAPHLLHPLHLGLLVVACRSVLIA